MTDVRDAPSDGTGVLEPGLARLSDDSLTIGYDEVLADCRRADWARLAFEAEIGDRRMWKTDGATSLRAWISMRTAEGDRAAGQHAFVATALPAYPRLSALFAQGGISFAQVRLLLVLATLTDLDDDDLVRLGTDHTVAQLEVACRAARRLPRHQDAGARRSLTWSVDDTGTFHLRGRLTGIDGVTVTALLAAMAKDPVVDPDTGLFDPFDARCADALVDLCTDPSNPPTVVIHAPVDSLGSGPSDTGSSDTGSSDTGSAAGSPHVEQGAQDSGSGSDGTAGGNTRSAPGSGAGNDAGRSNPGDGAGRGPGGDAGGIDAADRRSASAHRAHVGMTWDGVPIPSDTLHRLLCDARLRTVIEDPDGRAVGIGRLSKIVPHWLGEQVRWRDGHCRFPGCEHNRWTHIHHVVHWTKGGPTDLNNLTVLCSRHHGLVHEGQWRMSGDSDVQLVFTSPSGREFPANPALHPYALRTRRRRRRPRRGSSTRGDPGSPGADES